MKPLGEIAFRQKLNLLTLFVSLLTLLLASTILLWRETARSAEVRRSELLSLAKVLGATSVAALEFGDARAADEDLSAVRLLPDVVSARLYSADGRPFASYARDAAGAEPPPELPNAPRANAGGRYVAAVEPIDFGRERVSPEQLLNRFITPMEHQLDYFSLRTGQKVQVPLRHVLIIATNLSPETVTDPAFLRRMGYRLFLDAPTPEQYARIFQNYAQRQGVVVAPEMIERLLERYKAQNRELRACEPRDLIERARDICRFHGKSLELTAKVLDLAWSGYFGEQ